MSEKKIANFKKLGTDPTAKTIYKTLKSIKKQQDGTNLSGLNILNNHFISIGPKMSSKLFETINEYNTPEFEKTMVVHPTNEKEICEILHNMKNNKSCGYYGISNVILKC